MITCEVPYSVQNGTFSSQNIYGPVNLIVITHTSRTKIHHNFVPPNDSTVRYRKSGILFVAIRIHVGNSTFHWSEVALHFFSWILNCKPFLKIQLISCTLELETARDPRSFIWAKFHISRGTENGITASCEELNLFRIKGIFSPRNRAS